MNHFWMDVLYIAVGVGTGYAIAWLRSDRLLLTAHHLTLVLGRWVSQNTGGLGSAVESEAVRDLALSLLEWEYLHPDASAKSYQWALHHNFNREETLL